MQKKLRKPAVNSGHTPEAIGVVRAPGQVSDDAGLGVGAHCNDQGAPVALQHLAAAQQQAILAGILHNVVCLARQLTLVNPVWTQRSGAPTSAAQTEVNCWLAV